MLAFFWEYDLKMAIISGIIPKHRYVHATGISLFLPALAGKRELGVLRCVFGAREIERGMEETL